MSDENKGNRFADEHHQLRESVNADMERIRKESAGADKELAALKALAKRIGEANEQPMLIGREAAPAILSLISRIEQQDRDQELAAKTIHALNARCEQQAARIAELEGRLSAVTRWLEANQPDVFRRGLWDAVNEAEKANPTPATRSERMIDTTQDAVFTISITEAAPAVDLSGLKVPEDFNYSTDKGAWPDFGDYVLIEQKRFGVPNEMFVHKVIQRLRSNSWIDVPAQTHKGAALHDSMEDVVRVVCCGVCEDRVEMYRVADCKPHPVLSAPVVREGVMTDERIAELNREAQDQGISGIAPSIYLARAVEREVLATGKEKS